MTSAYGPDGSDGHSITDGSSASRQSMECQLFESLVHHLIEKGVLTTNDALSIVQTVAEVKHGELEDGQAPVAATEGEIGVLRRLYSTFELMRDRSSASRLDSGNILQLRPPLHGDGPEFPQDA